MTDWDKMLVSIAVAAAKRRSVCEAGKPGGCLVGNTWIYLRLAA